MELHLNDIVQVSLTDIGAGILNKEARETRLKNPRLYVKNDYQEGEIYRNDLWSVMKVFGKNMGLGQKIPFNELKKATQLELDVEPGKLKTHVLTFSRVFPTKHPKAGKETRFIRSIEWGAKKHTIRSNYPLWKKRIDEVNAGKATLSLRYWEGKPYRSKQAEIKQIKGRNSMRVQKLDFRKLLIDGEPARDITREDLAKYDGLSYQDFTDWFKDYDLREPLAIIIFNNRFKY